MVLTEDEIFIESENFIKKYFLKDVRNLEVKNEFEISGRYGKQDPLNSNKMSWKLATKGDTNYISFVVSNNKSQIEKIRYNFLIRSTEHAEELYELFKIWQSRGIIFKR
ncbi:MAG: hypothetical protein V4642_11235 [Bacteroidota bacterium]